MTTIAFKDGWLVSDSLVTIDNLRAGYVEKIHKVGDFVIGFSGSLSLQESFLKHIKGEEYNTDVFNDANFDSLVFNKQSKRVDWYTNGLLKDSTKSAYYALGSGGQFALGAMAMGATAEEAVKIAIKLDIYSGGKIQKIKIW